MTLTNEEWRPVPGYDGIYEVSNTGRVKSLDREESFNGIIRTRKGREMAQIPKRGYRLVKLCKNGTVRAVGIHRIVASAFIPNPEGLPEVNHKDEVRSNNNVDNLEWCDRKYNANYGTLPERIRQRVSIPVISIDSNGNETEYRSMKEAASFHQGTIGNISACLRGRTQTAFGLKWRYASYESK